MEASLSRLRLPSIPTTPLETDGGDSSSDDDNVYAEDDTSLGRDTKAFYQKVLRQCTNDFQKEKKDALRKVESNIHKFALGKKMCAFVWQSGPLKGKRCEKERSGKHGKYCTSDHQRQVKRRGKRSPKKLSMPSGATIFLDANGLAHCQPQMTQQEQQLLTLLNQLRPPSNAVTAPALAADPALAFPTVPTSAPLTAPVPPPKPAHLSAPSTDSDLERRFTNLTGFQPVYMYPGTMPMQIDSTQQPAPPTQPQFPTYHFT